MRHSGRQGAETEGHGGKVVDGSAVGDPDDPADSDFTGYGQGTEVVEMGDSHVELLFLEGFKDLEVILLEGN